MHKALIALSAVSLLAAALPAAAQNAPGETQFRELYKELVETNTAISNGSCTVAAETREDGRPEIGLIR